MAPAHTHLQLSSNACFLDITDRPCRSFRRWACRVSDASVDVLASFDRHAFRRRARSTARRVDQRDFLTRTVQRPLEDGGIQEQLRTFENRQDFLLYGFDVDQSTPTFISAYMRKFVRTRRAMLRKPLLTTHEVAELLQIKEATVRRWIRDGELPAVNLGRDWRVAVVQLEEFIKLRVTGRQSMPTMSALGGEPGTQRGELAAPQPRLRNRKKRKLGTGGTSRNQS
jgi:excisionase family DNA binding protein